MRERFKDVPDPRTRPNRMYPWQLLWGLISATMASACQTPTASARWITAHHDDRPAVRPPAVVRLPCESTIRRTLAAVAGCPLDAAVRRRPARARSASPARPSRPAHPARGAGP